MRCAQNVEPGYPGFMLARAVVALNPPPPSERHARTTPYDTVEITGVGDTWEAAKAACQVPDGGLVLAWWRE